MTSSPPPVGESGEKVRALSYTLRHTMVVNKADLMFKATGNHQPIYGTEFGGCVDDPYAQFYMAVYMNGSKPRYRGQCGVFVHMRYDARRMLEETQHANITCNAMCCARRHVSLTFTLLKAGQEGEEEILVQRRANSTLTVFFNHDGTTVSRSADGVTNNWGYRRFCSSNTLLTDGIGSTGQMVIRCRVNVVRCLPRDAEYQFRPTSPVCNQTLPVEWGEDATAVGGDIALTIHDVHKRSTKQVLHAVVLSASSPMLRDMCKARLTATADRPITVEVDGPLIFNASDTMQVLHSTLYTGAVPPKTSLEAMVSVYALCTVYELSTIGRLLVARLTYAAALACNSSTVLRLYEQLHTIKTRLEGEEEGNAQNVELSTRLLSIFSTALIGQWPTLRTSAAWITFAHDHRNLAHELLVKSLTDRPPAHATTPHKSQCQCTTPSCCALCPLDDAAASGYQLTVYHAHGKQATSDDTMFSVETLTSNMSEEEQLANMALMNDVAVDVLHEDVDEMSSMSTMQSLMESD